MQHNTRSSMITTPTYQPNIIFPKGDNNSQIRIIRIGNPTSEISSPHKRSHSEFRSSYTIKSKGEFDGSSTNIPQNDHLLDKIEVLNSRIQSLQEQSKIMLQITSSQEECIQQKQAILKRKQEELREINKQKTDLQNKFKSLEFQMAFRGKNVQCIQCEDINKQIKIKESTIKFYQEEVNKSNRLNAELKVQKIDLINELSELRLKLHSNPEYEGELERLRSLEIELEEEIRMLRKENVEGENKGKSNPQEKQYKLESELRGYRVKAQEMEFQIEQMREQINQKQMHNEKLEKELISERKLKKLLEESLKSQPKSKDEKSEMYNELITIQRRFQLKCQEVNMLSTKLKNLQSLNNTFKSTSESNYSEIKNSCREKDSQLKEIKLKLHLEEKEKIKYRTQLNDARLELEEANKLFTRQLGLVESKIEEYNNHLQEMEKQIDTLHDQNATLKEQLNIKEIKLEKKESRLSISNTSNDLIEENKELNKKVHELVRENSRIFKDYVRLNNYKSQNSKVVEDMKHQAFDLFKKLEQFESRIYKQNDLSESSLIEELDYLRRRFQTTQ